MRDFNHLLSCKGKWTGRNAVKISSGEGPADSPSTIEITPILFNRFIRIDQTWDYKSDPQAGSMLVGFDAKADSATMHWIDTWHNGVRVMPLVGRFEPDGRLVVRGTFSVPDSPDWGWRIEISAAEEKLHINMFCVKPTGQDDGGVSSTFTRV